MFTTVTSLILFVPMPLLILFSIISIFKQSDDRNQSYSLIEEERKLI